MRQLSIYCFNPNLSKYCTSLVTLPFGIYTCILGIGVAVSASDYILEYMIIVSIGALIFKIARHYIRTYSQLTLLFLLPILALYSATTISVTPILTSQSGIQFTSYIEKYESTCFRIRWILYFSRVLYKTYTNTSIFK